MSTSKEAKFVQALAQCIHAEEARADGEFHTMSCMYRDAQVRATEAVLKNKRLAVELKMQDESNEILTRQLEEANKLFQFQIGNKRTECELLRARLKAAEAALCDIRHNCCSLTEAFQTAEAYLRAQVP